MFTMYCRNLSRKAMLHFSKTFISQNLNIGKNVIRSCNTAVDGLTDWSALKSKYSDSQQSSVLEVLKKCNKTDIKKYNIPETFVNSLKTLPDEVEFKSLDDLISQNLLGPTELDTICSAISAKQLKVTKKQSIVTPPIKKEAVKNINTVVGLRIGMNQVSWSQLTVTGTTCDVSNWSVKNITELPLNASAIEITKAALAIADTIPDANAYVMEKEFSRSVAKLNTTLVKLLIRQQQILSVILASIYMRKNVAVPADFSDLIYMMKAHGPAKHFGLYMGHETVSSSQVISELFQQQYSGLHKITSLIVNDEMEKYYSSLDHCLREELSMCLLLTLTFFDLAIL